MIRPDYLILGYVIISVPSESVATLSARFFKRGISVKLSLDGRIIVSARKAKEIIAVIGDIEYEISEVKGFYGFILSKRKRYGFIAALMLSAILVFISSNIVWDVRIEGCESGREDDILTSLADAGLYTGAPWWSINKSSVELDVLSSSDAVSWININRRGSVAYVRVVDMDIHEIPSAPAGYANIVASRDCIVEEITVKRGVAAVKPGESVKAGDMLISGVIPTELGGGYCYAEGSVKARYTEYISVDVSNQVVEKSYGEEGISSITLNFFSFPINILKTYRNSDVNCDIIEKKRVFDIFGSKLPVSFDYTVSREYTESIRILSTDELAFSASEKLREKLLSASESADLISVSTDGEFYDSGYSMWAYAVIRGEVSEIQEFEFDLE